MNNWELYLYEYAPYVLGGVQVIVAFWAYTIGQRADALAKVVDSLRQEVIRVTVQAKSPSDFKPAPSLIRTWESKLTPELRASDPAAYEDYKNKIKAYG